MSQRKPLDPAGESTINLRRVPNWLRIALQQEADRNRRTEAAEILAALERLYEDRRPET
jgi:hypothetical protein